VDAEKVFSTKKAEKAATVLTASASVASTTRLNRSNSSHHRHRRPAHRHRGGPGIQGFRQRRHGRFERQEAGPDVATLIDSIVVDLMKDKVIPQMLKMTP
jgi:hypothetical protein